MTKTTTNRSLGIYLMGADTALDLADAEQPYASIALEQFKAGRDIEVPVSNGSEEGTGYIPYHAIRYISVEETKTSSTIEDEFCVEE